MDVVSTDEALAQLVNIPSAIVDRVVKVAARLRDWPNVSGAKRLTGDLKGNFRIRTGDYRVIFRVEATRIVIWRVANRRDVYDD